MPTKKLFVTIASLTAMVILSGCQTAGQVSNPTTQTQSPQSSSTQTNLTDAAAQQGALQLNDPAFCEKITDETSKQQCKTDIADRAKSNEAQQKMDATICEKLSTKDKQEACKIQVEVAMKHDQQAKDMTNQSVSNSKLMDSIAKSGDYTKCKNLEGASSIRDCEINILANKAVESKTESWCDKASTESAKSTCRLIYQEDTKSQR